MRAGRDEGHYPSPKVYAYDRAPRHPKSRFVEIDAPSGDAAPAAIEQVVAWLKGL